MNLPQLYYFKKIAELQSINQAAKQLHISQPALTKQIKLLEVDQQYYQEHLYPHKGKEYKKCY